MLELIPFQLLVFYLVPFLVAAARRHDAAMIIGVANVLLGWTVVGWIVLFGFAAWSPASGGVRSGAAVPGGR